MKTSITELTDLQDRIHSLTAELKAHKTLLTKLRDDFGLSPATFKLYYIIKQHPGIDRAEIKRLFPMSDDLYNSRMNYLKNRDLVRNFGGRRYPCWFVV